MSKVTAKRRGLYNEWHHKQVGKTIRSRHTSVSGIVKSVSRRYCAACQRNAVCFCVVWENGRKSFPCAKGVEANGDELLLL